MGAGAPVVVVTGKRSGAGAPGRRSGAGARMAGVVMPSAAGARMAGATMAPGAGAGARGAVVSGAGAGAMEGRVVTAGRAVSGVGAMGAMPAVWRGGWKDIKGSGWPARLQRRGSSRGAWL